jgi:hypothetical protein
MASPLQSIHPRLVSCSQAANCCIGVALDEHEDLGDA